MAGATEQLSFTLYLIVNGSSLSANSHTNIVATILDSSALKFIALLFL